MYYIEHKFVRSFKKPPKSTMVFVSNTITLPQYAIVLKCRMEKKEWKKVWVKTVLRWDGARAQECAVNPVSLCVCWVTCSSEQESDGWGRARTADTHRPGMEIDWATATELQHCRLEQCNNKEQQQKDKNRLKTERQRSSLSRGAESVIVANILAVLKYTCGYITCIQHAQTQSNFQVWVLTDWAVLMATNRWFPSFPHT